MVFSILHLLGKITCCGAIFRTSHSQRSPIQSSETEMIFLLLQHLYWHDICFRGSSFAAPTSKWSKSSCQERDKRKHWWQRAAGSFLVQRNVEQRELQNCHFLQKATGDKDLPSTSCNWCLAARRKMRQKELNNQAEVFKWQIIINQLQAPEHSQLNPSSCLSSAVSKEFSNSFTLLARKHYRVWRSVFWRRHSLGWIQALVLITIFIFVYTVHWTNLGQSCQLQLQQPPQKLRCKSHKQGWRTSEAK